MPQDIIQSWPFHLLNYLLAALGYTLLARLALGFFVRPDWDNYIWRFFVRVSDPALALARWITPQYLWGPLLPAIAAFWTFALRIALYYLFAAIALTSVD